MATWHEVGTKNVSITVYPSQPVRSWNVSVSPSEVYEGGTMEIVATIYWEAPGGVQFKLDINAFGKHLTTNAVAASTSPTTIRVPMTVPKGVTGKQNISVALYAYY